MMVTAAKVSVSPLKRLACEISSSFCTVLDYRTSALGFKGHKKHDTSHILYYQNTYGFGI